MPTPRRHRDLWLDAVIAALVAGVSVVAAHASAGTEGDPSWVAQTVLVAGAAALVARRRAPATVLVATSVSVVAFTWLDQPSVAGLSVLVATYTAVAAGHRWLTVAVVGAALTAATVHTVSIGGSVLGAGADTLVLKGWLLASGILGEVVRKQRDLTEQSERRVAAAERATEEAAWRRASEERLRIARELHDSLTHSISIITVQTKVAAHLASKRGETVPPALLAIEEASTQATRELRATLEVLRDEPPPRIADPETLTALIDGVARAGVAATLSVDGKPSPVPAEVDSAAYRIIQEALTNVARHAGPARATVRLGFDDDALTVEVIDDGSSPPDGETVPGVGLRGMRERAEALGGRINAGPRAEGGFRVEAWLPLRPLSGPGATT